MRCVSNVGDFVPDEECNMNLRPVDVENCDMGACAKSWFYTEWGTRVGVRGIIMFIYYYYYRGSHCIDVCIDVFEIRIKLGKVVHCNK